MTRFQALFGIKDSLIRKNCILLPIIQKNILREFQVEDFTRGKLYSTGNNKGFSLIHTGVGSGFVGDAVLYLKDTACQNIILFGSCGLVHQMNGLSIGSIVIPRKSYANESFSDMLLSVKLEPKLYYPDHNLFHNLIKDNIDEGIKEVNCMTVSSLKLEEEMADSFAKKEIDIVDMESSALFSASSAIGLNAIAMFYVNDILLIKPFYETLEPGLRATLSTSIKNGANLLCRFIEKRLSD